MKHWSHNYMILAALSGFIVTLDQATKMYIHTQFSLGESLPVIHNFFDITYVRNKGAAFGIFSTLPEAFREPFFLIFPPIAMVIILFILRQMPQEERAQVLALAGVFGGALGNYLDRLQLGYVVDFLDFHWANVYRFPAFNVADMAIVVSVTVLLIKLFLEAREEFQAKKQPLSE